MKNPHMFQSVLISFFLLIGVSSYSNEDGLLYSKDFPKSSLKSNTRSNSANNSVVSASLAAPIITAQPTPTLNICAGSSATFSVTADGAGSLSYQWRKNGTNMVNGGNVSGATTSTLIIANVSSSDADDYTCVITDDADTANTITSNPAVLTVKSLPALTKSGNTTLCFGQSTTLSISGAISYFWNTGSTSNSITVNPTSSIAYNVIGTGANGCSKTEVFEVQVNSLPSISINGTTTVCSSTPTTLTASGAQSFDWGSGLPSNASITVSPSSNTVYTVTGTDNNSCVNTKTVEVVVSPIPDASVSATSPICSGSVASFTILGTANATVVYRIGTGSNANVLLNSSGIAVVNIAGATNDQTLTLISVTLSGCQRTTFLPSSATVQVNEIPLPPTTSAVTYCQNQAASSLTALGNSLKWYLSPTGGSAEASVPTPSTIIAGATTYYVSQTINGCESPRAPLLVTVKPLPSVPTVTSPINYCPGDTAAALTAVGTGLLWYTVPTSGSGSTLAPTPTTSSPTELNYFVSQTLNSCEGPRANIKVIVNSIPANPTITYTGPVTYCQNQTASPLVATGSSLKWYTLDTGGTGSSTAFTPSTTTVGTTSYYVSQTINGCESGRTQIDVLVNPTPLAPAVNSPLTYCLNDIAPVLSTATVTGNPLKWYTSSSGGTALLSTPTPNTGSAGTVSYYVTETNTFGCESPRSLISVTVNALPNPPSVTASAISYCKDALASPLSAVASAGHTLRWYTVATGGTVSITAITPSTNIVGVTTYYVSQVNSAGCESARASIEVTVKAIPTIPTYSSPITVCQFTTASLVATPSTGGTIKWYSGVTGGSGSLTAPNPSTFSVGSSSYYVSQTIDGCESPRGTITVTVNATPATPTISSVVPPTCTFPKGSLQLNNLPTTSWTVIRNPAVVSGTEIYNNSTSTYSITDLDPGTYTFTVSNGLCTSPTSSSVTITPIPVQSAPIVGTIVHPTCTVGTGSVTLTNLPSANWTLTSNTGDVISGSGSLRLIPNLNSGTYSYTVKNVSTDCVSVASSNVVIANQPVTPSAPSVNSQFFVSPATVANLEVVNTGSLGTIKWYTSPTGNTLLNSSNSIATGTYYVSETQGSCESSRTAALITVDLPTNAGIVNAVGSSTICSGGSANLILNNYVGSILRWESSPVSNFTSGVNSISNTTDTYTATNLTTSLYFRAVVQSGVSTVLNSTPTLITVNVPSIAGTLSATNEGVCRDTVGGLLTLNTSTKVGTIVQWQQSTNNGSSWSNISNTATTYNAPALSQTTQFRVEVKNGLCSSAFSNVVEILVKDTPVVPILTNQLACLGETKVFGTTPQNSAYNYAWTSNRRILSNNTLSTISILFDQAFIEDITLTISPNDNTNTCVVSGTFSVSTNPLPNPVVVPDTSICVGNSITIGGNSTVGSSYKWSSIPAGFTSTESNPLPGVSPVVGTVYIVEETVTATGCKNTNNVTVDVQAKPVITIVGAPQFHVCETTTQIQLQSTITNHTPSSIVWSKVIGSGTFDFTNIANPKYSPSLADIAFGSVRLRLTVTGIGACSNSYSEELEILIDKKPIANAGLDVITCGTNPVQINATGTEYASNLVWTLPTGITGSLDQSNPYITVYTPSINDQNYVGPIELTLVASSGNTCSNSTDTVSVLITKPPVVNAGPATATICEGTAYSISTPASSASNIVLGSLNWTTSGDGSFSNLNDLNTVYTPGPGDISDGLAVVLTLSGTGNSPCFTPATDSLILTIVKKPTVDLGVDKIVCEGPVNVYSNIQNAGTIRWLINGGLGRFVDATVSSPIYDPSPLDKDQSITFTAEVTPKNSCGPVVTDSVIYKVNANPVVIAGGNATICETQSTFNVTSTIQYTDSVIWTSTGSGSFDNANAEDPIYTFSPGDIAVGSVTFTIRGKKFGCPDVTDTMTVTIRKNPITNITSVNSICQGESVFFTATASNSSSVTWTKDSGSGTINNSNTLFASYVSNPNESGTINFRIEAQAMAPCNIPSNFFKTITVVAKPSAEAGVSATICEGEDYTIGSSASASNYSVLNWTSSGSGIFIGGTTLNPIYRPSASDINTGSVRLKLTAEKNQPCFSDAVDEMILTINKKPVITVVNSTLDVCSGEGVAVPISGSGVIFGVEAFNYDELKWETSGNGIFTNTTPGNLTTANSYTPSDADIASGSVILTLKASRTPLNCNSFTTQSITLTFIKGPQIDAGPATATICENGNYTTSFAIARDYNNLIWSSNGSGQFLFNTSLNSAVYTPSVADITNTPITLTLTAIGNSCNNPSTDTILLYFDKLPQITVPNDTSICESSTSFPITANVIDGGALTWSSDGSGTFSDKTISNPTYYPSAEDKNKPFITLTLTAAATAECATPQSKSFKLSFVKLPTVNAGSDRNICDLNFKVLNATATNYSAIEWSATGPGSLDMSSVDKLEAIYYPIPGQTGLVRLTLTVTPLAACLSTGTISDSLEATFIAKPTISVIPQANICADSPNTTILGTTIENASSFEWTSTSGTGTTINNKNVIEPAIIASATDILNGFIDLTITAKPNAPCVDTVSRNVRVEIKPLATVTVTSDLTVCMIDANNDSQLDPKTLSATFTNRNLADPSSINWQIVNGNGRLEDANSETPKFYPAPDTDEVKIRVSVKNIAPCTGVVFKEFTLKAVQKPVVTLSKTTDTVCSTALTYNLAGNTVLDPTNRVEWTRVAPTGTGNFGNPTTVNTTYTFSDEDRANRSVTLRLTAYADPLCSSLSTYEEITILIDKAPTATISSTLTVCAGEPYTATALNPDGNTLAWTEINGNHGTFVNGTLDTATFNQSVNNTSSFEIQLTSSTTAACAPKVVTQMITVQPKPIIDAGASDQYNCSSKPFVISGVTGANYDSVLWTIDDGSNSSAGFSIPTALNPTFTPSLTQINAGSVVLKVTAKAKSPCGTTFDVWDTIILHFTPTQTVSFVSPAAICEGETISLVGSAPNSSSVAWSTSSTAATTDFNNPTALNSVYTPNALDLSLEKVTLTLTGVTNSNCPTATESIEVLIKKKPTANAGAPVSLCQGTVNYIVNDASATNYDASVPTNINWTLTGPATILSGTQNQLNPTIIPTPGAFGEVVLTLTVTGYSECNTTAVATKTITIVPTPVITIPATKTICEGSTLTLTTADVAATNSSSVSWSASMGTFSPNNSLATIYTPATGQTGLINLNLTVNGVAGVCTSVTRSIALTIIPKPIVNAGVDGTICQTGIFTVSGANIQNFASYSWGVSGPATIQSGTENSLTPVIVPNTGTSGNVIITLTAVGTGACPVSISDNLTVQINPIPVVNAGLDDKLCEGTASYQLNGSVTNAATGTTYEWRTTGSGTIQPTADPLKPIYIPGGNDFNSSTGIKVIRFDLEATSTNGCATVTDSMDLTVYAKPEVNAGLDRPDVCEGTSVTLVGAVAKNYSSVTWTKSINADGVFDFTSSLVNPTYTLGAADTSSVTLTISALPNAACPQVPVTDTMTIFINKKPSIVASLSEITMCAETFTLPDLVTVTDASSILWTNITGASGTPGVVTNATTETPSFTPSVSEIANGFVLLKLTAQPKSNCSVTAEQVIKVFLTRKAIVNAGNDISICQGSPITLSGSVSNSSSYTWSHNGTGTIEAGTINSLNPKYNAGLNEVGPITFTLTATNNTFCSGTIFDTMTVTIKPNPIVNAGPDFTICSGSNASLGDAISSNFETLVWSRSTNSNGTSTSGYVGGNFIGTGINPTYVPSQNDIDLRYVYLTVTASNSACTGVVSDVVKVTIAPGTSVEAGVNATICEGSTFSLASANSNATSVSWTSSQNSDGTSNPIYQAGSFSSNISVNPTYTPSNDDITRGFVFLTITGTGNISCPVDKSTIRLDIIKKPIVTASDIQMCMSNTNGVILNGTAANSSELIWSLISGPASGYINGGRYFNGLPTSTPTNETAKLRLVAKPLTGCSVDAVKEITINIQALPIVEAGTNGATCYIPGEPIAPFSITGSSVANASSSSWTTSGIKSGKFNLGNPVIFESYSDNCVTETLTLTANGIGACSAISVSDAITLAVNCTPPSLGIVNGLQTVCQGPNVVTYQVTPNSNVQTYNWQVPNGATIVSGQGTNSIDVNFGKNAVTGTISVNGSNGCGTGISSTKLVTVNQRPTAAAVTGQQIVCAGTVYSYTASSIANADRYEWTLPDGSVVSTTTNTVSIPFNLTATSGILKVRGYNNSCGFGDFSSDYAITVVPLPTLNSLVPADICSNTIFNYEPTSTTGVNFTWTRASQSGISNPATSGTGIISEMLLNTTNAVVPVNYTIITTTASGCSKSEPVTVRVKPIPSLTSTAPVNVICSGTVFEFEPTSTGTGAIVWSRATVSGISQVAASGSTSINPKISETLTNTNQNPISVRYVLTLPAVDGCTGPLKNIDVIVNPAPNVTPQSSQVLCEGDSLGINFATTNTGGTSTFEWTNTNGNIGLLTSGSGSIPTFTLLNPSTTNQVATISVTPKFTNSGISCSGTPQSFNITVNPTADVNQPSDQVICNGTNSSPVTFSTTNTTVTTTYEWTNDNTSIGLAANGIGNILSFPAVNTTSIPQVATIVVTPTYTSGGVSCIGLPKTFRITVNPTANVVQPISQVVCANSLVSSIFTTTNTVGTTSYAWNNNTTSIGLGASGIGSITPSFIALNSGTTPVVATIDVTPTYTNAGVACTGEIKTFTIIVNPAAQLNPITSITKCSGDSVSAINFSTTNTVGTTTYAWINSNPSIGLGASGNGNIPTFTASNSGTTIATATITVTPTFTNNGISCTGPVQVFTITVNPVADMIQPVSKVVCNGETTSVNFTTANSGTTTYEWSSDITIGMANLSGTGSIANFTATNTGNSPVVATITVIPTYINNGVSCVGLPKTFTITVNPSAEVNQPVTPLVLCNGTPTSVNFTTNNSGGTTVYAWTNNTPSIGIGTFGIGSIPTFPVANLGTAALTANLTVTPTFANAGRTCTGVVKNFSITINPTAQVNQPNSQVRCNGELTTPVTFSTQNTVGTTTYTWTNDTPGIGLIASGTGDIAAFTPVNSGSAPLVATIVVTPSYLNNGVVCTGPTKTFTITVNPVADVSQPTPLILCNGVQTNVNFGTANSGGTTSYSWTNDKPSIGLGASGFGAIPNFTVTNSGNTPVVSTIVVTPTFTNAGKSCTIIGNTKTFTITVNPSAQVVQPTSEVICNGSSTTAVNFTTTYTSGVTTFSWTNSNPSIGIGASGTGSIPSFTGTNTSTTPQVGIFVVTPTYTDAGVSCTGPSKTFTITVNPIPQVNQPTAQVICNGDTYSLGFTTLNTGGTTAYSWTNNNTSIGLSSTSGTGGIPSFTAVNSGLAPTVATITVTPSFANGGASCSGLPRSFTITVNPTADVIQPSSQVVCNGASTTEITFSSLNNSGSTTYSWTNSNTNIGLPISGSGTVIPSFNAVNSGNLPVIAIIKVTPTYTNAGVSCTGPTKEFTITVNPTAEVNQSISQVICNGSATTQVNFSSTNTGGSTTYSWTNNNTTIGLASNGSATVPSFNAINTGTTPVVATIVVTPTYTNALQSCTGPTKTFTITVNPSAEVVQPIPTTLCNGETSNVINFSSLNSVGTTTYTWTNTNTSIGLGLNGSGVLPSFTALNLGTSPISSTVTVTPVYTNGGLNCSGSNKQFVVTVNPSAEFNQPTSQELCSGTTTTAVNFTTINTGGTTTYSWNNSNTSIGLGASGSGTIPPFTAVNSGATPQIATITVTGTYSNAGKSCTIVKIFTYTVYPIPRASISGINNFTVCQNDPQPSVTFTGSNGMPPYTFSYSIGTDNFVVSSSGTSSSATISVPTLNTGNQIVRLIGVSDASVTACSSTTIILPNEALVNVLEQGTIIPVSSSTITQTPCQGSSIDPIIFTIGGSATSAYATNLPAGLTGVFDTTTSTFTISGRPTATGIFDYIIHTAGSFNGCNSTFGGTLTVKADDVITALTPVTTSQVVCSAAPIQSISYNLGGGATGGDVTFTPRQPNGIVWSIASNVLTISGTSTEVGTFTYTVQSYGICDQTTVTGTIDIKENATVKLVSGNPNPSVCIGNSLGTALQYGITTTTSATMVLSGALPTGVSFNTSTGEFTGIPTQSGSFPYTISSSTGCGNVLSGRITVNPAQSIVDVTGNATQINLCVNSPIDPILFKVAPGVTKVVFNPALPMGITSLLDANNIVTISGTPTIATSTSTTYVITTQGSCGPVATANITFDIKPAATITFLSGSSSINQSVCQNGPIVPIRFTIGGGATGIVVPTLPSGLSIVRDGSGVYTISGNPNTNGSFTIPITTLGCPITENITIVNINSSVSISLISAIGTDNQTQCQTSFNSAIVPIRYSTSGVTGVTVTGLPVGVINEFNLVTGELVISGTPTQSGIYNYQITTLPCNNVKTGVIRVSTPMAIFNEVVTNVSCSSLNDGSISLQISGGVASNGAYAVRWTGPNGFQQNQMNISGLAAGNYVIAGTDAVGCNLPTKSFTVLPASPINISIVSTTNVSCNGSLGCANLNYTGGTGIYTKFVLQYLDPSSQVLNTITPANNNYFNICNLKPGIYYVSVTDSNNCTTEPYLFTIRDFSTLKINSVQLDESLCSNTTGKVRLTVASFDPNLTFYYNNTLVPHLSLGNNVYELAIANPTTPTGLIKVVNSENCWDTITLNTTVINPSLSFTSLNLTTYGNVTVNESIKFTNGLTATTIPPEYDYLVWDFGDNSPLKVFYNPEDINPNSDGESLTTVFHSYAIDGLYPVTLTAYNRFGCSKSITEVITVGQGAGIMLPTAFSPNNDGINDLFRPSLLGLKEVSMYIYDHWGNLIYEISSDTASLPTDWGWNGLENGKSEPVNGTYRYYIMAKTINDLIIEKEGQFILIK